MNGISVFRESDRPFVRTLSIEEDDHVYDRKARELDEVAHAAEMECEDDWMSGVDVSRFARDLAPEFEKMGERIHPSTSYDGDHRMFPKPAYSYSCLIALAMKNSKSGQLTVAEIYAFMCEHFPYFRTAPSGWKNSVRHNLSLNKCFMKVEVEHPGQLGRKSCLWMIRPEKAAKMESDIQKWREKNPMAIEGAMPRPQDLAAIQEGRQGVPMEDRSLRTSSAENSVPAVKSVLTIRQNMSQSTSSPRPSIDLNNRVREGVEIRISDRDDDTIIRVGSSNTRILPSSLPTQYSPAEKLSDLLPLECMPKLQNTPPRAEIKMEKEEFSITLRPSDLSPVQVGYSSYEAVHDALTNNSLLACALDQSPYKGPVTFPSNMRL